MKTIIGAFLLSIVLAVPAGAVDFGGKYKVDGTNFNGSKYSGVATITITSDTTCSIEWATGGDANTQGICMRNDDAFAADYVMGKDIGLIIYKVAPDGSMKGLWTIAGNSGVGTETLTPMK